MERKNIRLKEYDYSQNGAYFITICTNKRRKILSKICRVAPTIGNIIGEYKSLVMNEWLKKNKEK